MQGISRRGFLTQVVGSLMIFPFVKETELLDEQYIASNYSSINPLPTMTVQLIRHATLLIKVDGVTLLVDPMLSDKGVMEPVANSAISVRIPMVDLPFNEQVLVNLLQGIDAVLITHTHRDHWDEKAIELLDKKLPVFCQPSDEVAIREKGFVSVCAIEKETSWNDITITRTDGQHGTGEIGKKMGQVSGFVLKALHFPTVYIAGDTIWCQEVNDSLHIHQPAVTIINAGAAQFKTGDPITMAAQDVAAVCKTLPSTKVIAVHMDTINHCLLSRKELTAFIQRKRLDTQVHIPADGESMEF